MIDLSFDKTWQSLSDDARMALRIASLFSHESVHEWRLLTLLTVAFGQRSDRSENAVDECLGARVIRDDLEHRGYLRIPERVATAVRRIDEPTIPDDVLRAHARAYVETAADVVIQNPEDTDEDVSIAVRNLDCYPRDINHWRETGALAFVRDALFDHGDTGPELSGLFAVAAAWLARGHFAESLEWARAWRSVATD